MMTAMASDTVVLARTPAVEWARVRKIIDAVPYWLLVALALLAILISASQTWIGEFPPLTLIVLAGFCWAWTSGSVLLLRLVPPRPERVRITLRRVFLIMTCAAIIASVSSNDWPFRLRFALSQRALDELADRVADGQMFTKPQRAGLFVVDWSNTPSVPAETGGEVEYVSAVSFRLCALPPKSTVYIELTRLPPGAKRSPYSWRGDRRMSLTDRWWYAGYAIRSQVAECGMMPPP